MDQNNISLINMIINLKKEELLKVLNNREDPNDEGGKQIQELLLNIHTAQNEFTNFVNKGEE